MGIRTAIVDVADDVQMIDGKPLDELAQRLDERAAAIRADDASMMARSTPACPPRGGSPSSALR